MRINLQSLLNNAGVILMLGAALASAPTYIGSYANAEGFRIEGREWNAFNAASGVGVTIIEALTIYYAFLAMSRFGKITRSSITLGVLTAVSIGSLVVVGTVYSVAATRQVRVTDLPEVLGTGGGLLWFWSGALMILRAALIGTAGVAHHVYQAAARQLVAETSETEPAPALTVSPVPPVELPKLAPVTELAPLSTELTVDNVWEAMQKLPPAEVSARKLAARFNTSHTTMHSYMQKARNQYDPAYTATGPSSPVARLEIVSK